MTRAYEPKPFRTKRKDPVRRWLARMSYNFKAWRGAMQTPLQRRLAVIETLFIDHTLISLVNPNRHKVTERIWRSGQPTPGQIAALARQGLRTIVNLRGERDCASYFLEAEACRENNVQLMDFPINSRQPPSREILQQLEPFFSKLQTPALIHCKAGADRAGIMSALYLLVMEKQPVEEALKQLSPRYGHVRRSKAGVLDRFLEEYRDFTKTRPISFMDWAMNHYDRDAVIAAHQPSPIAEWLLTDVLKRE